MRTAPETVTFTEAEAALGEGFCPAFPVTHGHLGPGGFCGECDGEWLGDALLISVAPPGWDLPPAQEKSSLPLSITFNGTWADNR